MCACLVGVVGCGQDDEPTTRTNSLTVDYGHTAPTWVRLSTTVTASPFSYSDTVAQLPEGEFDLAVLAGSAAKSEAAKVRGQLCEMSLTLGKEEKVTVRIDGLHEFGDKGDGGRGENHPVAVAWASEETRVV